MSPDREDAVQWDRAPRDHSFGDWVAQVAQAVAMRCGGKIRLEEYCFTESPEALDDEHAKLAALEDRLLDVIRVHFSNIPGYSAASGKYASQLDQLIKYAEAVLTRAEYKLQDGRVCYDSRLTIRGLDGPIKDESNPGQTYKLDHLLRGLDLYLRVWKVDRKLRTNASKQDWRGREDAEIFLRLHVRQTFEEFWKIPALQQQPHRDTAGNLVVLVDGGFLTFAQMVLQKVVELDPNMEPGDKEKQVEALNTHSIRSKFVADYKRGRKLVSFSNPATISALRGEVRRRMKMDDGS